MNDNHLVITPQTKIADLLDEYPQAEEELISITPAFKKLKNPMLRKTIAKLATLQQAAEVAGLPVAQVINRLRIYVGQSEWSGETKKNQEPSKRPEWILEGRVIEEFDARPLIEKGKHPVKMVMEKLKLLNEGEMLTLVTSFTPVPLMDMARSKGYRVWSHQKSETVVLTYFSKTR